jgi:23S rRNA (cytosine1962-C5)-methyltransferase
MNASVVILSPKLGPILKGHPWIFPKAIKKISGSVKTGELVNLFSEQEELIGVGVFNEHSLYRVRVLALAIDGLDMSSIEALIRQRLHQAILVRKSLNLPNPLTTAYRLFNSEGDGLSGLTIDRFNQTCVVSSTAFWIEANKSTIIDAIQQINPADEIIWFSHAKSLAQDGWTDFVEVRQARTETVFENGISYLVDFSNAQKTGLFLDQRDNHSRIAALASGKRVLDLYTYTGGFALHAAKAGASFIKAVDSSEQAICAAAHNAEINGLHQIEWVEGDAREYLQEASEYDIVILDPPKLAPSQQHLQRAKNYYRFLHREVIKAMQPGSLLMTCNCSSALTALEFANLAYSQARAVGKSARVLGIFGPATCHPTLPAFPEGHYLTAILLGIV